MSLAYAIAPTFFTALIVGGQYGATAGIIGRYAFAALLNALLSVWVAHFIGLGRLRIGVVLAVAVVAEMTLIPVSPDEATALVWILVVISGTTQIAAVTTHLSLRRRGRSPAGAALA